MTCTRRHAECIYVTEQNETRQVAVKRKFDELSERHSDAQSVIAVLAGEDENLAKDAFCRLRAGHSPQRIVQSIRRWNVRSPADVIHERQLCQQYLVALLQSTASLWDVVQAATRILNSGTRLNFPSTRDLLPLKNYVITLESLGEILDKPKGSASSQRLIQEPVLLQNGPDGFYDGSLFWMPASPWTDITNDDRTVSQLVSTFFVAVNPYWRFLEEDPFIRNMRLKNVESLYCSPLLVNAVLACASVSVQILSSGAVIESNYLQLFSEVDGAFAQPDHILTRGEHFHHEAMRLWTLERGQRSVANVQALLILAIECVSLMH